MHFPAALSGLIPILRRGPRAHALGYYLTPLRGYEPIQQPEAKRKAMQETLARWRLVLGKYAQTKMPDCLSAQQQRMADALEQLYSREYRGRGVRQDGKL